ncbi:MAG: protein tyrosine phosphatase [Sandaracinaceae bacterium]|nr:protein tyrosine phosphatase [Sandaracinaceae bacterium]
MSDGYVDLHCHYLPGIDDGVRTLDEGLAVLRGLGALGFSTVVATPHIRTAMFDNRKAGLERAYGELVAIAGGLPGVPATGLGAEHYLDDVFWELFLAGEAVPYPGGKAALVELHYEVWPRRIEERFFEMQIRGVRPVLAHPERYAALFGSTDPLDPALEVGVCGLLDVMSLVGRYGHKSQRAAERMLDEGVYYAACTDAHRPGDVELVARAIERLRALVGAEETEELLAENPRRILAGTVEL